MRIKPGPSSARLFSKCTQSTMSGLSSLKIDAPRAPWGVVPRDGSNAKRVKSRLLSALVPFRIKGIFWRPHRHPQRHGAQLEVTAHRIEQIAAIAFGQLVDPRAEDDEGRR